ncbi:unnamed protein product [Ectocarpus sp. 8 AP-2014]|uniref:Aldo/Keto Reductase n=1 Tax=Ectocarpus siliculosus TaxID=2880 RepID=D7FRY7_ECTSI|nr:Aldo/Keto Reductase [Ectocarpus siliculosus]|eukprot:CBJ30928.1 Aldo/Keto Reductase [Ectocarpus siliculosus]
MSLSIGSTVTLSDGIIMPRLGLGTWRSATGEVETAVKCALKAGYLHIDCAWCYGNQVEVGKALADAFKEDNIIRENVFITTKLWNTFHRPELLKKNLDTCLKDLGLPYVDCVQLHYSFAMVPCADETVLVPRHANGDAHLDDEVDLKQTWKAMEGFVESGLAKTIGVSNFTKEELAYVMEDAKIMPSVLQVEIHPYLPNTELLLWCKEKNIHVTAYAPLGNVNKEFASCLDDPVIIEIAERMTKSPAQVIIRWHLQRGVTVIPKSVTPARILANKDVYDFDLSNEDMAAIDKLGERNLRMCNWKYRPGGGRLYEGETSAYPEK